MMFKGAKDLCCVSKFVMKILAVAELVLPSKLWVVYTTYHDIWLVHEADCEDSDLYL